jgi:1-acyl-sn-glycerol-3-phosphate acyltransferase
VARFEAVATAAFVSPRVTACSSRKSDRVSVCIIRSLHACVALCLRSPSSLAKLVAMAGLTCGFGAVELAAILAHLTSKRVLPKRVKLLPPPTAAQINLPPTAEVAATLANRRPRKVTLEHRIARRFLYIASRMKQMWGRSLVRLYDVDVRLTDRNLGTPHALNLANGPYLMVLLNQCSLLEAPTFPSAHYFPSSFFMNWEYCAIPFLGWNSWLTGISIDRANSNSAQAGADEAIRLMRDENVSFYMSIEGRRSEDGGLCPYKRGAAVMAISAGATIVPIISKNMRTLLPFGDWRVRPGQMEIIMEKSA